MPFRKTLEIWGSRFALGVMWVFSAPFNVYMSSRLRFAVVVGLVVFALGIYAYIGGGGAPDAPLKARLVKNETHSLEATIARLAERLRATPENADLWKLMAQARTAQGDHMRAGDAWRRHISLQGASAEAYTALAENLITQENGIIQSEAFDLLTASHRLDPERPATRYLLGLAYLQQGETRKAVEEWDALFSNLPDGIPLKTILEQHIAAIKKMRAVQEQQVE